MSFLKLTADQRAALEAANAANTATPWHRAVPVELEDGTWIINADLVDDRNFRHCFAVLDPVRKDDAARIEIDRDMVKLKGELSDDTLEVES